MKKILAGLSIAMFVASPVAFAQDSDNYDDQVEAGGAAGADNAQTYTYAALAGVSAAALIGAAFAVSDSDNENVDLGGTTTTTTAPTTTTTTTAPTTTTTTTTTTTSGT